MNFYDVNCSLGGWPFRRVPRHTASELRADLTELGALGALVCNNGALLYRDTREANRELAAIIAPHRNFFIGCATIDPTLPQAENELRESVETLGFRALRLLPRYHDYPVEQAEKLARLAGKIGIPVLLPSEIVNFRQRHRLEPQSALMFSECIQLAELAPETIFVWLDAVLPPAAPANIWGEFDRGYASESVASRLLLGTGMPLRSPASLLKFSGIESTSKLRDGIALGNFRKLFLNNK